MAHSHSHCSGNPTFNEVYAGAYSEVPENLSGVICKTPPIGHHHAPRFAQCCSGPVYNITSPTDPDSPVYPVTCATLCQIDPAYNAPNEKNPYGWSNFFMCLTNGGLTNGVESSEVFCDTLTVPAHPAPTSFSQTPTGVWMTATYSRASFGELEPWPPTIVGSATGAGVESSTSAETLSVPTSESVSDYSSISTSATHPQQPTTGVTTSDSAVTAASVSVSTSASATASPSTSSANSLRLRRLARPVLVAVLALGLFNA